MTEPQQDITNKQGVANWDNVKLQHNKKGHPKYKLQSEESVRDSLSDVTKNYKLTKRIEKEIEVQSEEKPVFEQFEEVESNFENLIFEEKLQINEKIQYLLSSTNASKVSLNAEQFNALRKLVDIGIDIENDLILNIIEPHIKLPQYDWEPVVTRNSMVPLRAPHKMYYSIDKTFKSPTEISSAVRQYIDRVLSLKYKPKGGVPAEVIRGMKKYIHKLNQSITCLKKNSYKNLIVRLDFNSAKVNFIILPACYTVYQLKDYILCRFLKNKIHDDLILKDDQIVYTDKDILQSINSNYENKADKIHKIISFLVQIKEISDQGSETTTEQVEDFEKNCIKTDTDARGYKNTKTNVVYINVCTQTSKPCKAENTKLVSRAVQTPVFPLNDKNVATVEHKSTQMKRNDYFVDSKNDRIICAQPYVPTNPNEDLIQRAMAIRIQRRWRKKEIKASENHIKNEFMKLKHNEHLLKSTLRQNECIRQLLTMVSPMFLNRCEDFYMLYLFLDNWWKNQTNNEHHKNAVNIIKSKKRSCCMDKTTAAASQVLKAEFKHYVTKLMAFEKLITDTKRERRKKQDLKEFEASARPTVIKSGKGYPITIDTVESQRAKQLKELYETLQRRDVSVEQRVKFLLHLKAMLCEESKELAEIDKIVRLIDRELDFIDHGISKHQMETLKQRIELHFLKLIKSPHLNPNMEKILTRKYPKESGGDLLKCNHCSKLKHINAFQNESFSNTVMPICKGCFFSYVIGSKQEDYSKYSSLLKMLREDEIQLCTLSPVVFLIHESTIQYLVFYIWRSKSVISQQTDLSKLKLARWIIHEDWTPWNNILLTKEEYVSHSNVKNVETFYRPFFINEINLLNMRARNHFRSLAKLESHMKSIFWFKEERQDDQENDEGEVCL